MRSGLVSAMLPPRFPLAMVVCVGFPLSGRSGKKATSLREGRLG